MCVLRWLTTLELMQKTIMKTCPKTFGLIFDFLFSICIFIFHVSLMKRKSMFGARKSVCCLGRGDALSCTRIWLGHRIEACFVHLFVNVPPPPTHTHTFSNSVDLRLEREGEPQIFLSCAVYLITKPLLNICRHAVHQIKAEYHMK